MNDRVVVITGATGDLGKLVVRAFAEQGASLALVTTDQDKLDALAHELDLHPERILTCVANLLDESATQAAAEAVSAKFGRVDVLIHLIGGWTGGKVLAESEADDLKFMLDRHTWTTFNLLRAFSPKLTANGWGRVIAVTSPFATKPSAKMGPYAVGKAGQETMIMTLADEFAGTDLTANVIQVKSIDMKDSGNPGQTVGGEGASPEEIIAAMLYLCSDEARKMNGVRLPLF